MAPLAFLHSADALQLTFATACLLAVWSILCGVVGWKLRARGGREASEEKARAGDAFSAAARSERR